MAAIAIAAALGADLEELVERKGRAGLMGYVRSALDGALGRLTDLEPARYRPENYDLVIFGSPVWAASLSAPVRAYLRRYYDDLEEVAFFCTCGGRGGERVLRQMADLCRKEPAATVVLRQAEVLRHSFRRRVDRFALAIREALRELDRFAAPGTKAGEERVSAAERPIAALGDSAREAWENEGGCVGERNAASKPDEARPLPAGHHA
jgi:predicted metal-binding protein